MIFFYIYIYQTGTLHEVYTMLDGEETAALVKLRDGLDRLHQSKINSLKSDCVLLFIQTVIWNVNREIILPYC